MNFQANFSYAGHSGAENRQGDAFQVRFFFLKHLQIISRPIDIMSESRNAHSRVVELAQMANEVEKELFREF